MTEDNYRSTIRVTSRSDEYDSSDSAVLDAPDSGPARHIHYTAEWLTSSMVRFHDPTEMTRVEVVAELLGDQNQVHFCVDTSQGAADVARMSQVIDLGLLARERESDAARLLLATPTSAAERDRLQRLCYDRTVVAAIASSLERRDLINSLLPLVPWLRQPLAFDAELRHVTTAMFDHLQKHTRGVLMPGKRGSEWSLYSAPNLSPQWSQIGFPHAPHTEDIASRPVPMPGTVSYEADECDSGLTCFFGTDDLTPPSEIATLLRQKHTLYLLIDSAYLSLGNGSGLIEVRTDNRDLVLVTPDSGFNRMDLIDEYWNRNCLICLFSGMGELALANHLQQTGRWLATPLDLRFQLAPESSTATSIFRGVSAVLSETNDDSPWTAYCDSSLVPFWRQLGFPNAPDVTG